MNKMFNVDEIIATADLIALVERAGGKPQKRGSEYRCACPLHGGDNQSGFSIYEKNGRQTWTCFSGDCGTGDVITFVEKWQFRNITDAKQRFKNACEFLDGRIIDDPKAMMESAEKRLAEAKARAEAELLHVEARRKELQSEQKHLWYHENMKEWGVQAWLDRGLNESWQGYWYLGACDDFDIGGYHTPTLTIPIFDENSKLLNIKHRLLNPPSPKDKYRPEESGLGCFPPIMAFTDLGWNAELFVIVEGEIKALVTATITPESNWQFIGVPGRNGFDRIIEQLKGKRVVVIPDPGAEKDAAKLIKAVNARYVQLSDKIDDLIKDNEYDGGWLKSVVQQARKVHV